MQPLFELDPQMKSAKLSKGMKRKAGLVLAMAHRPELLRLDEPTAGLDPIAWRTLLDELKRYMADGRSTVVIATHILEEVRRLADYVAFLHGGQLLGFYEKDSLAEQWKTVWVERLPDRAERLAGVVAVESDPVPCLITQDIALTEAELRRSGIMVKRTQSLQLDEIFVRLVRHTEKARSETKGR